MDKAELSVSDLARAAGVSPQAVSQWLSGTTNPQMARHKAISDIIARRIAERSVETTITSTRLNDYRPEADRAAECLPINSLNTSASAGGGRLPEAAFLGSPRYFERSFIEQDLRARPGDLLVVEIEGQSMEPLMRHGDLALVDQRKLNVAMEGIFVLFDGDGVVCKWVEPCRTHDVPMLRISSENSRFPPYEVEADRCQIVGRVVWFARRL